MTINKSLHYLKILVCFSFLMFFVSGINAATSLTYEYDANGNLIQGNGKYYEYNDANQLLRVRHGDQNGPIIAEYFYDYTGQRIKKIENGVTTYFIGKHYETQGDGESQTNTSYYFANGERVAKKDQSGNIYFYHLDHLGGTNAVTDSTGNLIERIKYYPFGEIREGGNEKYSFTGKEKDKLTEFYYFEARYYNPEFKHFTQADTIVPDLYEPQNLNRYAYVRNNPEKYVDPSGHAGWLSKKWNQAKDWTHDTFGPVDAPQLVQIDPAAYKRCSPEAKEKIRQSVSQMQQNIGDFSNAQQDYVGVLNTTEKGLKVAKIAGKASTEILKINPSTKIVGTTLDLLYLGADIYQVSQNDNLSTVGKETAIEGRVFLKMTSKQVAYGISKGIASNSTVLAPVVDNDIARFVFEKGYSLLGTRVVDSLSERVP